MILLEALGANPFLALPASGGCLRSLAYGLVTPISAFSSFVCIKSPSASLVRILVISLRAHLNNPGYDP